MTVRIEKQGKVWTAVHSRPVARSAMDPVIAAVAGPTVAGRFEIALWCDLRVMEASAYFGVYCRRWGVPLIDGGTVRLLRIVGRGRALDLILTGRKVEAEEALRLGQGARRKFQRYLSATGTPCRHRP